MERYRSINPGSGISSYPYTITGTARGANIAGAINGSLSNISSDAGDTTTIVYELNSYFDNTAASVVQGGGMRVKQVTEFDGINTANNMVTNYSYTDPATGISSGRPVNMPVFAFTTPYTGSGTTAAKWASSTVRSEDDLSNEDETIVYKNITVSHNGAGNVQYEYTVPATFWDSSSSPDWVPTMVYSGRVACTTATFATNQTNNYPYPVNTNFDFERGLLKKMSTFNQTGQQTGEDTYTYQRSYSTPSIITGFKFDNNTASARNYSKYSIYTGTSLLLAQQTKKVFDMPGLTTSQTSTTTYNYASTAHKLLTSTQATNSDGSVLKNYIKYTKDYTVALGTDSVANALYRLQRKNINVPVEQYQQVQRSSGTKTTNASLTLFKTFFTYGEWNKPAQSLQFVSAAGVSDFQPSGITSNAFTRDSRYIVKANYLAYGTTGTLQSVDDGHHNVVSTITDFILGQPVLAINNALIPEFGYDDFEDTSPGAKFTYTDSVRSNNARSGNHAAVVKPTSVITRSIKKSLLASNYIFSIWVNSSTGGTITLQLTDGSHTFSYPLTYTYTDGKWKYLEMKVPITSMLATFTCKIISSTNALIDDVLFYPETSNVNTTAYDSTSLVKTSETNTNGVSVYYGYDNYGRLQYIYDQDKNIVRKKTYVEPNVYAAYGAGFTEQLKINSGAAPLNYNNIIWFINTNPPALAGCRWTWDYGDGTPPQTTTDFYSDTTRDGTITQYSLAYHTYAAKGDYTVTLSKYSSIAGTKTSTQTVHIDDHTSINVPLNITNRQGAEVTSVEFEGTGSGKQQTPSGDGYVVGQGLYSVTIHTAGPVYNPTTGNGFKSLYIECGGKIVQCSSHLSSGNIYTFLDVDLNGQPNITVGLSEKICADIH
jgi:hypothetical protein